jgi:glycosyltransferase involved in cell wall biosynthesis
VDWIGTTNPLRIALVAPAWFPVPPKGYGGIEAVVHLLALELIRRGHQVTTFAVEGSDPELHPISLVPGDWGSDLGSPDQPVRESTYQVRVNRELRRRARELDLVHLHTEFPGVAIAALLELPIPCLATMHGDINPKAMDFLREVHESIDLVAISHAQREQASGIRWRAVVHNAVRVDDFEARSEKERYLLQLARITPDKGQHIAIEVAERVGLPLVMAGKVDLDAESQRYFKERVEPKLSSTIRWIEDVRDGDKADLLGKAMAMLFPIQWEEPFGLAMVEAMVSATPVLAFRRGAVEEIVDPVGQVSWSKQSTRWSTPLAAWARSIRSPARREPGSASARPGWGRATRRRIAPRWRTEGRRAKVHGWCRVRRCAASSRRG